MADVEEMENQAKRKVSEISAKIDEILNSGRVSQEDRTELRRMWTNIRELSEEFDDEDEFSAEDARDEIYLRLKELKAFLKRF